MENQFSRREIEAAAYLRGLRTASELAEDHGIEWLKGYVVGVAVGTNDERQGRNEEDSDGK